MYLSIEVSRYFFQYVVGGSFLLGLMLILMGIFNPDFFFGQAPVKGMVRALGRSATRIFYGFFGLFLIILPVLIFRP